ncbi:MAG: sulfotransferase [Microcoleaceae cyanobacterium]
MVKTLPNFLIIGAPKAGTTSLYRYLDQHPQVYMSPVKEPHFFTFENEMVAAQGPGDQKRLKGAVTRFEDYCNLFQGAAGEIAIGEASTTYLSSPKAAERIQFYLPQVKLIVILRHPIEAAYASFLHLIRDGDETVTDFAEALDHEKVRIQSNWDGLWHYKTRGFYYQQLKRYFDRFDPQQIRIYRYEALQNNSRELVQDLFSFIGVDPTFCPDLEQKYNVSGIPRSAWINQLTSQSNPMKSMANAIIPQRVRPILINWIKAWNFNNYQKPEISAEVRHQLMKDYQQDILKLQDLVNQDFSDWLNC